jgi:hypothetical protein
VGRFLDSLQQRIEITDKVNYHREQYQSFMTGPEWRNVEMAEEYAQFIKEGNSIFHFPYFRQISDLWKVVFNSYSAARKYNSFWQIISSEYMLMDLFVGFFTTVELLPKGILSLFLSPLLSKKNDTEIQRHLADFYRQYAADLQTIPFYDHHYEEIRRDLSTKYKTIQNKTWGDWFSWSCTSVELWARKWISKPLSYWFHQDTNLTPATTDILVKYNVDNAVGPKQAQEQFQLKVNALVDVSIVAEDVYVKQKSVHKSYTSVYARLRVPRYAAFQDVLKDLEENNIHLRKIAGQDRVQVKCLIDANSEEELQSAQDRLRAKAHKPLYHYGDGIHPYRRLCMFDVPVLELAKSTKALNQEKNCKVTLIHNF